MKQDNHQGNKMGEMPVGRLIINMSWPAILSMFIQAFYNVVDSYVVSLISEQALAAVTSVSALVSAPSSQSPVFLFQ